MQRSRSSSDWLQRRIISENTSHLVVRSTEKRVAVASERPVHPGQGQGEGFARDKFRVSGTKEMVEGAGANKVSEVLSEASCYRCGTSNFTKERGRHFSRPHWFDFRPQHFYFDFWASFWIFEMTSLNDAAILESCFFASSNSLVRCSIPCMGKPFCTL